MVSIKFMDEEMSQIETGSVSFPNFASFATLRCTICPLPLDFTQSRKERKDKSKKKRVDAKKFLVPANVVVLSL